jgi:hypothetical protein
VGSGESHIRHGIPRLAANFAHALEVGNMERLQTIVDESCGPQPVMSSTELLTMLEQHIQSMRLGCELAYQRQPTGAEGNAHEYHEEQSMGASHASGECFVPAGSWRGKRCALCSGWMWGSVARVSDWQWATNASHAQCELIDMADRERTETRAALWLAGIPEDEPYPYDPAIDEHERSLRTGGRMLSPAERVGRLHTELFRLRAQNAGLYQAHREMADELDAVDVKLDKWSDWLARLLGSEYGSFETTSQAQLAIEEKLRGCSGSVAQKERG